MAVPLSLIIVGRDSRMRAEIRAHLMATRRLQVVAESADRERAVELIGHLRPHGVIIIVDGEQEGALELVRQIRHEHPETAIICTGEQCSSEVIVRAYRAGAHEFLMQPPDPGELQEVLDRLSAFFEGGEQKNVGRVLAVYSGRGGSGTTTIAVNIGADLAHRLRQETVLVDLNLHYGCLPVFLGIEPTYSLADVAHNEHRLDVQLLRSFLTKAAENLYCLSAPLTPEEAEDVFPSHLEVVIGLLRTQFATVILDVPHGLDPLTLAALDHADLILVVTLADMASLYTTKRVLETFRRMEYGEEKVRLILNRYVKSKEMPVEKIGRALGHPVAFAVGEDGRAALEAINVGKPLVLAGGRSPLVRQFAQLAQLVMPAGLATSSPGEAKRGVFRMLFGGGGR